MAAHPILLEEFRNKGALQEITPVYDLPEDVHKCIKLILVLWILVLSIAKSECQICRQQAHHWEGEKECCAMDEIGRTMEFVGACIAYKHCERWSEGTE